MRLIAVVDPKVKPIGVKGKQYVYKVNKLKGCFVLTKGKPRKGALLFKQVECPKHDQTVKEYIASLSPKEKSELIRVGFYNYLKEIE